MYTKEFYATLCFILLWFTVVACVCLFKLITKIFLIIPVLIVTVTLIFIITVIFASKELICWDFTVEMIFNVFQSFSFFPIVLVMKKICLPIRHMPDS